jgi:hydroxymethylglutaryl-CoA synthase
VLAQSFGSGAGTVTALIRIGAASDRPSAVALAADRPTVELSYVQYAKSRGVLAIAEMPAAGPPFAASPSWERSKAATVGLVGTRCRSCGSLNFPRRAYCLDCRGQLLDAVPLPRTATVLTYNLQHIVAISPEEAPQPICTALLDGEKPGRYGGKVAALITDAGLDDVRVGMPVELVPRRGDVDDGLVKYGWKFRPLRRGE